MLKTVAKIELFVNKNPKVTNRSVNPDHVWFVDEVDMDMMKLNNWLFGDYDALYRVKLPETEFFTDKDGLLKLSKN